MKRLLIGLLAGSFVVASSAFAQDFLTIGTGGVTGVYYPVGGATAKIVNDADVGLRLTVESTGGSVFNIKAMQAGQLDLALAQSDVVYQAANAQEAFEGDGVDQLRTVMGLHPEPLHLVCDASAGVASFSDIAGKRVNIGNPGSGIRNTVLAVMDKFGFDPDSDIVAESVRAAEAPDLLRDGRIDCFFYTVGIGGAAIQDISTTNDITLVPLEGAEFEALVDEFPYYAFATVPGGTYNGVDEDVTIFGVKALFTTTTDLDEETVYTIVSSVLANLEDFQATHPALRNLTPESFIQGLGAPLHPGAERAYAEAGMM